MGSFAQTQSRTSLESILEQSYGFDPTFHRAYHYDIVGRIDAEQRPSETTGTSQRAYSYDQLGRLLRVEDRQQSSCDQWPNTLPSQVFFPDSLSADNGWRFTCVAQPTTTETFSYDEVGNRTDNGGSPTLGNRYLTFKGVTYTYDLDGNVTRKTKAGSFDRSYTWSAENRLLTASDGTTRIRFDYNASGQLVTKWIGPIGAEHLNRYFIWDGQQLLAALDSTFQRIEEYEYASGIDDPITFVYGPLLIRAPAKDALGNVLGFGDSNIFFAHDPITYDTWGTPSASTTQSMSLRWKGSLWDGDAQLSYARNRWYDPDGGRFMSEDPAGLAAGVNLYAFAGNDPVNGSDPLGLDAVLWARTPLDIGGCEPGREFNVTYCDEMRRHAEEAAEQARRGWAGVDPLDVGSSGGAGESQSKPVIDGKLYNACIEATPGINVAAALSILPLGNLKLGQGFRLPGSSPFTSIDRRFPSLPFADTEGGAFVRIVGSGSIKTAGTLGTLGAVIGTFAASYAATTIVRCLIASHQ
jgi:RHS repeat-associated protein